MAKLILLVLDNPDQTLAVLETWARAGISGATILESSGLGRQLVGRDDLPWDRFLTHRFRLEDMVKAFAVIEAGQGIKTLIDCE